MSKRPCIMWWQGAPCEVSMADDRFIFIFYNGDGTGHAAEMLKSDIRRIRIEHRRTFAGMKPAFSWCRSALMATLFGGVVGAAEMVATTKAEPSFEQKWFFVVDGDDESTIELEFDYGREYNSRITKQGVSTFLKDFKRNKHRYSA